MSDQTDGFEEIDDELLCCIASASEESVFPAPKDKNIQNSLSGNILPFSWFNILTIYVILPGNRSQSFYSLACY